MRGAPFAARLIEAAGDAPPPPGLRLPRRIGEAPHGVPGPSRGAEASVDFPRHASRRRQGCPQMVVCGSRLLVRPRSRASPGALPVPGVDSSRPLRQESHAHRHGSRWAHRRSRTCCRPRVAISPATLPAPPPWMSHRPLAPLAQAQERVMTSAGPRVADGPSHPPSTGRASPPRRP
jgi:hypothetical protein